MIAASEERIMVPLGRPNRWLVEPESTAGFIVRALVGTKEEKRFFQVKKERARTARKVYVSLDRADAIIDGWPSLCGFAFRKGWDTLRCEGSRLFFIQVSCRYPADSTRLSFPSLLLLFEPFAGVRNSFPISHLL